MKQKIKSWADITVGQFIDLQLLSKAKDVEPLEHAEQVVAVMYGLTDRQVEELPMQRFNELARECVSVMTSELTGKPKRVINGLKGKYKVIYDPRELKHRQFVEIQHFVDGGIMENIHNIMASLVQPIGKLGFAKKNTAEMHPQISEDLLHASIADIYHSCVFFCKLYLNSLVHIQGYLIHQMMQKGATKEQATALTNGSINAMAGFITQKNWLILNV